MFSWFGGGKSAPEKEIDKPDCVPDTHIGRDMAVGAGFGGMGGAWAGPMGTAVGGVIGAFTGMTYSMINDGDKIEQCMKEKAAKEADRPQMTSQYDRVRQGGIESRSYSAYSSSSYDSGDWKGDHKLNLDRSDAYHSQASRDAWDSAVCNDFTGQCKRP